MADQVLCQGCMSRSRLIASAALTSSVALPIQLTGIWDPAPCGC